MVPINVDEKQMEKMFLDELQKRLEQLEQRHTFWDMKEFCRQTCMSKNNIKVKFFYNPLFPK
ncbi:hypothetical protein PspKH34_25110 [Parageobacillus sp. KH3-4]|jgi:hypothetical protein|nr:hypothetical protein PspKH34_25110 [Parageobacillus sp. KH3-4]